MSESPRGELSLRTLTMPRDANPSGHIFGGWRLSQMDIAAGMRAGQRSGGRAATVAMTFKLPVLVGDILSESCFFTNFVTTL